MTHVPLEKDPGSFFMQSATPMAVLARDGTVSCANASFVRAMSEDSRVIGRNLRYLLRPADRARADAALDAAAAEESAVFNATPSHGSRSMRFHPTLAPGGELLLTVVPSPLGRLDEELRLAIFDRILESGPVAYFATDAKGVYTANDGKACERLGFKPGELVGKNRFDLCKDDPKTQESTRRCLAGEEIHTENSVAGVAVEVWHLPMRDASGEVSGTVGFAIDLTAQRDAERRVREKLEVIEKQNATLQMLSRVLETAPLILWSVDTAGVFTVSEGRGLDLVGVRSGEAVGQNAIEMYKDQPEIAGAIVRALGGEEGRLTISPATGIYFDSWMLPLRASDGSLQGAIGLAIDASERICGERQLREKLELIERQSATIRALATPIIQVWDEILCLPVIGTVDSARTADMMQALLEAIVREQARYAIVDLTGVEVVDTSTADHLIRLFRAAKVLGVDGILCGIRPAVAQTVVSLGLELGSVKTMRSLRDALKWCIRTRTEPRTNGAKGPRDGLPRAVNGGTT